MVSSSRDFFFLNFYSLLNFCFSWHSNQPPTHSTCQNGDSSNSSSGSGSRRNTSQAAGMFYYLIITLIIFRSPLHVEMVMAATATEGTAGGSRRGSRMGEGRKRAQTTVYTVIWAWYFNCIYFWLLSISLYPYSLWNIYILCLFSLLCV